MRIPPLLTIAVLTILSTAFYMYVGQLVPQKEVHPPEVIELDPNLSPEEMAGVGRGIFEDKGLCSTCHTLGKSGALRFPDLGGIGSRAGTRIPGVSGLQYLTQSLYTPDAYIVEGFTPGMPTMNRPPIQLTDQEILAVIAYLQTLGGTLTVSMETILPIPGREVPEESGEPAAETASAAAPTGGPVEKFQCSSCHRLDQPGRLKAVSLYDVGSRLSRDQIMAATLSSHRQESFYQQTTLSELQQLVDLLASKDGN